MCFGYKENNDSIQRSTMEEKKKRISEDEY